MEPSLDAETSQAMVSLIQEAIRLGKASGASTGDIEDLMHMATAMHLWDGLAQLP